MSQNPTSYDEVPYPSSSFPQSHPVKIATMAKLFGLTPVAPENCRFLELGSADGANLLPLAQAYPNSTFHGIDLSTRQVEAGNKAITGAGLTNVTLEHKNILDFPTDGEKYDYVVVHGIYSWVPKEVREKILAIARACLSENGVAYISYNSFPGWRMRGMLRDMVMFHTSQFPDVAAKVGQAKALVKFLADSVPTENNPYGQFIKNELELMKGWQDSYIRHDLLEDENQPFYFYEFVMDASKHDLQYLGEPELASMMAAGFSPQVQETLQRIGRNIIAMEQYMDFVRNRTFRQTLLVHKEAKLNRNLNTDTLKDFWFTTAMRPVSAEPNFAAGAKEEFKSAAGASVTTDNPLVKTVIATLGRAAPAQVSFMDLLKDIRVNLLGNAAAGRAVEVEKQEENFLAQQLMLLFTRGMIEATSHSFPVVVPVGERPSVTALARFQALNNRQVANQKHVSLGMDIFSRHLVALLDGTRDRAALTTAILEKAKNGVLTVQNNGVAVTDEAVLRKILEPRIAGVLDQVSKLAFLVPAV